jgi:peptide/nickel transport system permease protein
VLLGAISALRAGRPSASVTRGLSVLSVSVPQYSIALVLLVLLAVNHRVFPTGGMHNTVGGGGFGDLMRHAALPAVAAALAPMGVIARMFGAALTDVLGQEFIVSLRARGFRSPKIARHAMHNAMPSLLTITGLQLGYLLGGVVFVETIFSWPGLGQLVFESISKRDLPVIQAGVLASALAFVTLNLLVDAVHGAIDPRIRH